LRTRDDGFDLHQRCTQRFDDATREGRFFHCTQCNENVLDLSSLTYSEYQRWRERPRDSSKPSCVRAKVDQDGRILLAEESPARRRLAVLPALLAATVGAGCERSASVPAAPIVAAEPRVADVLVTEPRAATGPAAVEAITPPTPAEPPHPETGDGGSVTTDAAAVDSGAIVRVRHPHAPGHHIRRGRPGRLAEDFAGLAFK
jgi:hypothetical protein